MVSQLLLSFEGTLLFPEKSSKVEEFEEVAKVRKQNNRFSFYNKGLSDGDEVTFIKYPEYKATVYSATEVNYNGEVWKLSPLTREIFRKRGELTASEAYKGAAYWQFQGKKLATMPDRN